MNGEIYGLPEDSDLSDTEQLFVGVKKHGVCFLKTIEGEFSVVFYDAFLQRIYTARDKFGSKSLYYAIDVCGSLLVGSCTSDVACNLSCGPVVNHQARMEYLVYGVSTETVFLHVYPVPLGVVTGFTLGEQSLVTEFDICDSGAEVTYLPVAVRRRITNSCAVLDSGGTDSSLLSAYASCCSKVRFRDESDKLIASHNIHEGFRHNNARRHNSIKYIDVDFDLLSDQSLTRLIDRPLTSVSYIAFASVYSFLSHIGVEVSLSGEGADELFFGYEHYRVHSSSHPILASRLNDFRLLKFSIRIGIQSMG